MYVRVYRSTLKKIVLFLISFLLSLFDPVLQSFYQVSPFAGVSFFPIHKLFAYDRYNDAYIEYTLTGESPLQKYRQSYIFFGRINHNHHVFGMKEIGIVIS